MTDKSTHTGNVESPVVSVEAPSEVDSKLEILIEQPEKHLNGVQTEQQPTVEVSVADMTRMYSNHLDTIDRR